ncbi:MAG: hypothetical protein Q8N81_06545, partial [bacterium]|nr:hypothetical protein [bacterium]
MADVLPALRKNLLWTRVYPKESGFVKKNRLKNEFFLYFPPRGCWDVTVFSGVIPNGMLNGGAEHGAGDHIRCAEVIFPQRPLCGIR